MKSIIDGKRYNTETATVVACAEHGDYGDFGRYTETLHQTPKGRYFLHGTGGPASPYAEYNGNTFSGGADIRPMDTDTAYRWLETNGMVTAIEVYFPDRITDA
tara:strand:- start:1612 stop:1920 length:309 start_codon:yes stop_codon:yes gene_type:complete